MPGEIEATKESLAFRPFEDRFLVSRRREVIVRPSNRLFSRDARV
jgi:hypothetical protein